MTSLVPDHIAALMRAVELMGGQAAAARALSLPPRTVSAGLVWQWLNQRRPLPPEHCPPIEGATGIRCEQLRPEIIWTRDTGGLVTGYHVPLQGAA